MLNHETHPLARSVNILPSNWPEGHKGTYPGDFDHFANKGLGLNIPIVVRPWDILEDAAERPSYYGDEPPTSHPILNGPINDSNGGCIYTDGGIQSETCELLLSQLGVSAYTKDYVVFLQHSFDPLQERFLHQVRLVNTYALTSVFGVKETIVDALEPQPQSPIETMSTFVRLEQDMWGIGMNGNLQGAMGGDGDFAKEALGFGFLVENGFQGIARVWSRAWLVTK